MRFVVEKPFTTWQELVVLHNGNPEKAYYISCEIRGDVSLGGDWSHQIIIHLERYNDGVNSYRFKEPLSNCFATKEELIDYINETL